MADNENLTIVSDGDFETEILQADQPALVDFWAAWCGPCRLIAPHVESIAEELGDKVVVAKLDVDQNRNTAVRFGIQSIPTVLFFKDGKLADRVVGAVDKSVLRDKLNALL